MVIKLKDEKKNWREKNTVVKIKNREKFDYFLI